MAKQVPTTDEGKKRQAIFNYVKGQPVDKTLRPTIHIIDDVDVISSLSGEEIRTHIKNTLHTNGNTDNEATKLASMRRHTKWLRNVTGTVKVYDFENWKDTAKEHEAIDAVMTTVVGLNFMGSSVEELEHYAIPQGDKTDKKTLWKLKDKVKIKDEVTGNDLSAEEAITSVYTKLFKTWITIQEKAGVTDLMVPFVGGGVYLNKLLPADQKRVRECIHMALIAAVTEERPRCKNIKNIHYFPVVPNDDVNAKNKLKYSDEFDAGSFGAMISGAGTGISVMTHDTDMFQMINAIGKNKTSNIGILNPGSDRTMGGNGGNKAEGVHFEATPLEEQLFHRTTLSKLSTDHNPDMETVADASVDQFILNRAAHQSAYKYENDMAEVKSTSAATHNCLIHSTLGTKSKDGNYHIDAHETIRKFLFDVVNSFKDEDLAKKNDEIQPLRDLMNEIGLVSEKATFKDYRDKLCSDDEINKDRFLGMAEMRLLAIFENAYILNWTRNNKKIELHRGHVCSPDSALRALLMAHVKANTIKVPQAIEDCGKHPVRAIHIENSNDSHFSRIEWSHPEEQLFPKLKDAIDVHNKRLNLKKVEDNPKPPKNEEPSEPKVIPNPLNDIILNSEGGYPFPAKTIVWTNEEKKKIYRNNINYLLFMLAQSGEVKQKFMSDLKSVTPKDGTVVHRDANKKHFFYTNLHITTVTDVPKLLLENITAYEALKKPTSRLLSEYKPLKEALKEGKTDKTILDDARTNAFKETAFVRTEEKHSYVQAKVQQKLDPSTHTKKLALVHRKTSATKPSHYHMVDLGDLATVAQWVNHDMPNKAQYLLEEGTQQYRLFLSPNPSKPNEYQMLKCEVDAQGEYIKGATPYAITPAEELKWKEKIGLIFDAYAEHKDKNTTLHKAGFKSGQ